MGNTITTDWRWLKMMVVVSWSQWLKCNRTQWNAGPPSPIYGSKGPPTSCCYNAGESTSPRTGGPNLNVCNLFCQLKRWFAYLLLVMNLITVITIKTISSGTSVRACLHGESLKLYTVNDIVYFFRYIYTFYWIVFFHTNKLLLKSRYTSKWTTKKGIFGLNKNCWWWQMDN